MAVLLVAALTFLALLWVMASGFDATVFGGVLVVGLVAIVIAANRPH